eukprot:4354955-Prymnesium_polylepis.1
MTRAWRPDRACGLAPEPPWRRACVAAPSDRLRAERCRTARLHVHRAARHRASEELRTQANAREGLPPPSHPLRAYTLALRAPCMKQRCGARRVTQPSRRT